MLHAFSRSELLLGPAALARLAAARVAIVGIGGVGSFAAEGLVRSGIRRFVLVDHDRVCLTNLNRQLHATHRTVGRPKVEVMRERMLEIQPEAEILCLEQCYEPGRADELIPRDLDYLVDAIDTVSAKLDLIVEAQRRGIPVISAMGAGNKLDPTRFEVADIYSTSVCPLARVLRRELRRRGVAALKVVYSREPPRSLVPAVEDQGPIEGPEPVGSGDRATRPRRPPGSLAFVPSVAGLILASEVVRDLIGLSRELRRGPPAIDEED